MDTWISKSSRHSTHQSDRVSYGKLPSRVPRPAWSGRAQRRTGLEKPRVANKFMPCLSCAGGSAYKHRRQTMAIMRKKFRDKKRKQRIDNFRHTKFLTVGRPKETEAIS